MVQDNEMDRRTLERGICGVLWLGLFAYIWKGIGPHLLYHGFGIFTAYPVISLEKAFLQATLTTPGGVLSALAALPAQSYQWPWLGSLAIVAVLVLLVLGIQHLLRSVRGEKFLDLAWAAPLLALMIYNHYENPLPVLLALGLSTWMAILYRSLPARSVPWQIGWFLALFALLYYLAGATAFIFVAIVCLIELLTQRRIVFAIVQVILASGGAFVLGRLLFALAPQTIYTIGTPWDGSDGLRFSAFSHLLLTVLYGFVPGLILVECLGKVGLEKVLATRSKPKKKGTKSTAKSKRTHWWHLGDQRARIALRGLVILAAVALCLGLSRTHIRYERLLHYYGQQRDWDRVIAVAHQMRGRHPFTRSGVFDINRALAHQGRLADELCAYPQDDIKALFMSFADMAGRLQHSKLLELYLDLGCLNAAEKNAYELLDNEGPTPYVLEAMVRIHLGKGQYASARIAFGALQKHVGSRSYAHPWQAIIADPNHAPVPAPLQAWRHAAAVQDHAVMGITFEPTLKRLLQDAPDHRLAFEYLMAYYLLKHQRAKLTGGLPLLKSLGYRQLPRHYAEALLVHSLETQRPIPTPGWTIDPDLQNQFRAIRHAVSQAHGNHQAVFDTLAPKYGDTYTFYSMFNVCGVK